MTEITMANKKLNNNTTQFIITDTVHNIIRTYDAIIDSTDVWLVVTENINGMTTNIQNFYLSDCSQLMSSIRDFVEFALIKQNKIRNFDFTVNKITLIYVKHIVDVTEIMMLGR